jgi:hypothetical protein
MKLLMGQAGALSILLVTTGCGSMPVHDGRIQESYAAQLSTLSGTYEGLVELATKDRKIVKPAVGKAQLELQIRGNGEILVKPKQDLLGNGCGSSVGKLVEIRSFGDLDEHIFDAQFDFDPGKCVDKVDSRSLLLVSRKDCKNEPYLEVVVIKEYLGTFRHMRPLRYHGVFKKVQ